MSEMSDVSLCEPACSSPLAKLICSHLSVFKQVAAGGRMGMKRGFIKVRVVSLALDPVIVLRALKHARPPRGPLLPPICHLNCKINSVMKETATVKQ